MAINGLRCYLSPLSPFKELVCIGVQYLNSVYETSQIIIIDIYKKLKLTKYSILSCGRSIPVSYCENTPHQVKVLHSKPHLISL